MWKAVGLFCLTVVVKSEESLVFKSVPTTVKAFQRDTVLLPCYLETVAKGKSKTTLPMVAM